MFLLNFLMDKMCSSSIHQSKKLISLEEPATAVRESVGLYTTRNGSDTPAAKITPRLGKAMSLSLQR